jgi:5-methylcytosine-specific restriction endonuclease McrA
LDFREYNRICSIEFADTAITQAWPVGLKTKPQKTKPRKTKKRTGPEEYTGTDCQQFAVWKCTGKFCWFCSEYVSYRDSVIDHIVAKSRADNPTEFQKLLHDLELPSDFNVNGIRNLLPAHHRCNSRKNDRVLSLAAMVELLRRAKRTERRVRKQIHKMEHGHWPTEAKLIFGHALEFEAMSEERAAFLHLVIRVLENWERRIVLFCKFQSRRLEFA